MDKKILLQDIKIGMVFSAPLYSEENSMVVEAGMPVKESDYNRMIRWGVKELHTEGELIQDKKEITKKKKFIFESDTDDEGNKTPEYVKLYNWALSLYEDFLDTLKETGEIHKNELDIVTNKIIVITSKYKNDIVGHMALETDNYDFIITHAINSTIIAVIGGIKLELPEDKLTDLCMAGLLHDIGMMKIPKEILNKKEKLTDEEYNTIKSHPISIFKQMNKSGIFGQDILDAVLQHHEQFGGNGYPRKLKGEKINIYAKILAIADTFEAQIARRTYRKTKTGYMAMKSVLAEAKNRFDPKVLRAFLTTLSIYPPGTLVQMNDNSIGAVVSINPDAPLRPKVKIIIDEFGDKITENMIKDLRDEIDLFIVHVLNKEEYQRK